jgi:hypothetical protein
MKPTYKELVALDMKVDEAFFKYLADGGNDEACTTYWHLEKSYNELYEQADEDTKDKLCSDGWTTQ